MLAGSLVTAPPPIPGSLGTLQLALQFSIHCLGPLRLLGGGTATARGRRLSCRASQLLRGGIAKAGAVLPSLREASP